PRAPASLSDLARAASERDAPDSMPAVSEVMGQGEDPRSDAAALSSEPAPWYTRRRWVLIGVLFIAIGYALARWRDLLLPP
ncbi:MAG TPA: hypothetical protein VJU61_03815, partial [Polyangiaceae bacterium]|nr:hypothetical protein [Polyangiaceae bacterium]